MAAPPVLAAAGDQLDGLVDAVELATFTSTDDAYVYAPLPPATSYGHRAEAWNPDKWLQEVKIRVLTAGDSCFVRMLTKDTGELFAECPLPSDGTPLTTVVEPVVDSSRYFVTKVVDRESGNHAFIGIGFRNRADASDFSAALDDYRQYLRRAREAEAMRREFDALDSTSAAAAPAAASGAPDEGGGQQSEAAAAAAAAARDLSLKPGQTLHIKLATSLKRSADPGGTAAAAPGRRASGSSGAGGGSGVTGLLGAAGGAAVGTLRLPPPGSSSGFFRLQPPLAAGAAAAAVGTGSSPASQQQQQQGQQRQQHGQQQQQGQQPSVAPAVQPDSPQTGTLQAWPSNVASHTAVPAAGGGAAAANGAAAVGAAPGTQVSADGDDEEWGDFVG